MNLNYLTDITEAQALSYQDSYIQIYSNSWGPPDNGFLVQGPGYYSGRTLKQAVSKVKEPRVFKLECTLVSGAQWAWDYICVGGREWRKTR